MTITSKNQLQKIVDDKAKRALEKLALEVQVLWENYIQTRFYDLYEPQEYVRTYQLLNSVVVSKIYKQGNEWKIEVFMDESTVTHPYLIDSVAEVFQYSATGYHGTDFLRQGGMPIPGDGVNPNGDGNTRGKNERPIYREGKFYEELLADLRSGTFYNEFEKVLRREFGMSLRRK